MGPIDASTLVADPEDTAEARGWVVDEEDELRRLRHLRRRRLVTVEREVEIMRRYHRGEAAEDIAQVMECHPQTVWASVRRAMKRTLDGVGAEDERNKQLMESEVITQRLMERILPDPDADGHVPSVDLKAVDTWTKVSRRRAELTGADAPAKFQFKGEIKHDVAVTQVSNVSEYMALIDTIAGRGGYGSGVSPPESIEAQTRALEAAPVDDRTLEEIVADRMEPARAPLMPDFDSRPEE